MKLMNETTWCFPRRRVAIGIVAATAAAATACQGTSVRSAADETAQRDDAAQEMHDAATVLQQVSAMPEGAPRDLWRDARCVAILPAIVKAAFVVGAQYGRGVADCRVGGTWSPPAFFTIGGGSFGAQLGVQSTDLVLFVMNDTGMRKLLHGKVELGADASVAAGPVGRDAAASTDWRLRAEILAYSRSRGLFAGVDLGGAVLTQDRDRTRAVYGVDEDYRELLEGRAAWPPSGTELLTALMQSGGPPKGPAVSSR